MRTSFIFFYVALSSLLLVSCVTINHTNSHNNSNLDNKEERKKMIETDLESVLLNFDKSTDQLNEFNSLHLNVIDYKNKLIADIIMVDDIENTYENPFSLKIDIVNFDKTFKQSMTIKSSLVNIDDIVIGKIDRNNYNYEVKTDSISDNGKILNLRVESDKSNTLLNYSGIMINRNGFEVSFYAQTDPVKSKTIIITIYGALKLLEKMKGNYIDFCSKKIKDEIIRNEIKQKDIKNKKMKITLKVKPFANIFNISVLEEFYSDCSVEFVKK